MPIPLNVSAAPATRTRKTGITSWSLNIYSYSWNDPFFHSWSVGSYQSSWRTLLPPWLHSRDPARGGGPAGCPAPTSSAPEGPPHSGRRCRRPRLRRGSHLEDDRTDTRPLISNYTCFFTICMCIVIACLIFHHLYFQTVREMADLNQCIVILSAAFWTTSRLRLTAESRFVFGAFWLQLRW